MTIEAVPGTDLRYYLIAYDAKGDERHGDGHAPDGLLSHRLLAELRVEPITDVFVMSHGWQGDIPAARDQYTRWIQAMATSGADRARMRAARPSFRPLLVGLHWPSLPWGDEDLGPAGGAFAVGAVPGTPARQGVDALVSLYAERIADTPEARADLQTIFHSAMENIAPAHLPADVRAAYERLDLEARLGSDGVAGAPGSDRESFDAERAYQNARAATQFCFGGGVAGGLLAPLRQLSFWKMKDRARALGEGGAFALLSQLEEAKPKARIHLMGHSFGCIVAAAMVAGPERHARLPRPVDTLALVQGALSLWSFCHDIPVARGHAGYFHAIVAERRVKGAILTTQSARDTALRVFYPAGAGVAQQMTYAPGELPRYGAVGTFGVQGIAQGVFNEPMRRTDGDYDFRAGGIYNLDATAYIREGGGASGAHNDITRPEVAHAIWELARQSARS
ncbi:MAG: hypothetical protein Q7U73_13405 [Rubrivivax sp.]|nr:hypothetical protein [Rubrivivax sp.]